MLYLKNIKITGDVVSADVTPADGNMEDFRLVYDYKKDKILEPYNIKMNSYIAMARNRLLKLTDEKPCKLPERLTVHWF